MPLSRALSFALNNTDADLIDSPPPGFTARVRAIYDAFIVGNQVRLLFFIDFCNYRYSTICQLLIVNYNSAAFLSDLARS